MFSRSSRQRESISTLFPYYRLSLGILARAVGAFSVLAPMARLDSTAPADLFLGLLVVVSAPVLLGRGLARRPGLARCGERLGDLVPRARARHANNIRVGVKGACPLVKWAPQAKFSKFYVAPSQISYYEPHLENLNNGATKATG